MNFMSVLNQTAVLFILLMIGFIAKKVKIMTDDLGKGLSNLIIYVTLPALIITSMNYDYSSEMLANSGIVFIIGFFIYLFMILFSLLFVKVFHIEDVRQRGVYRFLIIFANVGFMGYPIVEVIFGSIGVFYAAIYNLWFNLLLWTLGIILVNHDDDKGMSLKKLINPGTISIAIGFSLFIFSIELPEPLFISLNKLGASTTPMAMLVVGSLLGDANFKEIFTNFKLLITSVVRLVVIPGLVLLVLSFFDLPDMVKGVPVIISAMPSAANAAIYARKYESDYRLASQGVFITTLLSIITIPLTMLLLTKLM